MKKRVLSLLPIRCLSLGLLPAGALAAGTQTVKTAVTVDYGAAIEAVEYLNQLRREAGLHDLVMDENLVKSAITRAEMVYHLWQLAGSPDPITSINAFSDLSSLSTQERKAIRWAVEENITNITSITTFSPSMVLTRAQVFTFPYRYYN